MRPRWRNWLPKSSRKENGKPFAHLHNDGTWIVRDDVWIKFLDRKGNLIAGYGSPNCIGPELQFGFTMGDHFCPDNGNDSQVLIIKPAWGGRSLYKDFRSPGMGALDEAILDKEPEDRLKNNPEAGRDEMADGVQKYRVEERNRMIHAHPLVKTFQRISEKSHILQSPDGTELSVDQVIESMDGEEVTVMALGQGPQIQTEMNYPCPILPAWQQFIRPDIVILVDRRLASPNKDEATGENER